MGMPLPSNITDPSYKPGDFLCQRYCIISTRDIACGRQCAIAREVISGGLVSIRIARKSRIDRDKLLAEERFLRNNTSSEPPLYFVKTQRQLQEGDDYLTILSYHSYSLETFLSRGTNVAPLSLHQIKQVSRQLMRGLNYLHSQDLVHCDVCPSNVYFISPQYSKETFFDVRAERFRKRDVLTDICVRIAFTGDSRDEGRMIGTDQYRAPEVVLGKPLSSLFASSLPVTFRSDLFSLGCVIAGMTTGRTLFPRLFGAQNYGRDCLLVMEHSIEYIPHKMAAELRRLFPTLLNSFEMVRVDREVHRRAEVYVEDESVTKLAEIIKDKDLYDVIYHLMHLNPDSRHDGTYILEKFSFFTERHM